MRRCKKSRVALEITFPRLAGYKYDLGTERIQAEFTEDSRFELSTQILPVNTENAPIVGETSRHNLDDLKTRRINERAGPRFLDRLAA